MYEIPQFVVFECLKALGLAVDGQCESDKLDGADTERPVCESEKREEGEEAVEGAVEDS
tara:strand:+ start:3642 stop:3818 length:177 start_codon:yes stop_codon:yes gene_type:complete